MFNNLFGALGKLGEAKERAKETREKLSETYVREVSEDGIEVIVTAMKQVKSITLPEGSSNEELATKITEVLNIALEKAGNIQEEELKNMAKEYLPNIPGLDGILGK